MFAALGEFIETMIGIWDAVQAGIRIGDLMDSSGEDAFQNLLQTAHLNAWSDIINNGNLNSGQLSMASIVQDRGSEALEGMGFHNFDVQGYMHACMNATEGAAEALSHSIGEAAMSINHAAGSTHTGIGKWAMQNFGKE